MNIHSISKKHQLLISNCVYKNDNLHPVFDVSNLMSCDICIIDMLLRSLDGMKILFAIYYATMMRLNLILQENE